MVGQAPNPPRPVVDFDGGRELRGGCPGREAGLQATSCAFRDLTVPLGAMPSPRPRHSPLFLAAVCALWAALGVGSATPPVGSGRTWDRKLDPFLRRVALGVERRQGVFTDRLQAHSP